MFIQFSDVYMETVVNIQDRFGSTPETWTNFCFLRPVRGACRTPGMGGRLGAPECVRGARLCVRARLCVFLRAPLSACCSCPCASVCPPARLRTRLRAPLRPRCASACVRSARLCLLARASCPGACVLSGCVRGVARRETDPSSCAPEVVFRGHAVPHKFTDVAVARGGINCGEVSALSKLAATLLSFNPVEFVINNIVTYCAIARR